MSRTWLDNYISFSKTGDAGICPKCGSRDVEVLVLTTGRNSKTFMCNSCHEFRHFDEQSSDRPARNINSEEIKENDNIY